MCNILLPGQVHHSKADNNTNTKHEVRLESRLESRLETHKNESREGRRSQKDNIEPNDFSVNFDGFASVPFNDDDDDGNLTRATTADSVDNFRLTYIPLNIVASMAQMVVAPPVDLLRKPG